MESYQFYITYENYLSRNIPFWSIWVYNDIFNDKLFACCYVNDNNKWYMYSNIHAYLMYATDP